MFLYKLHLYYVPSNTNTLNLFLYLYLHLQLSGKVNKNKIVSGVVLGEY